MEVLDLARWQFGITTVYHFFFVPLTIGLSVLVASMQTIWWRTGNERWLRLTKFFGKLFLINFAMGIATGIVQEFQFGMNWSDYSRFVGDIFGAPLAIEGLLAFFLESTFLGLWIFGWDRLKPGLHLACIWIAALGTVFSAYFILAANSFMQNPVGYTLNAGEGPRRAHRLRRRADQQGPAGDLPAPDRRLLHGRRRLRRGHRAVAHDAATLTATRDAFRPAFRMGAVVLLVAGLGTMISGDFQGKVMTEVQPMKMAAAEGLYEDAGPAPFSILTLGTLDGSEEVFKLEIPKLLSFLGTGTFDGEVRGIDSLQEEYEERFGPGDYKPNIPVTYWTFRLMITTGALAMAAGAADALGHPAGPDTDARRWLLRSAIVLPLLPLVANSFGWIFTEMGRQPWVVFGLMPTSSGVSPSTSVAEVATSLIVFTLLYGVLAVIEVKLLLRYVKAGLPEVEPPPDPDDVDAPLAFAY